MLLWAYNLLIILARYKGINAWCNGALAWWILGCVTTFSMFIKEKMPQSYPLPCVPASALTNWYSESPDAWPSVSATPLSIKFAKLPLKEYFMLNQC